MSCTPDGHLARLTAVAAVVAALTGAAPLLAAAPVVDVLAAQPASVLPGGLVNLTVEAHDPDCPGTCTTGCGMTIRSDLTTWSADGGSFEATDNGVTGSPYSATASWRAPAAEATYSITVSLSDSGTFICGGRQTTTASLDVQVTTILGSPPVIDSLTAVPAQLFPGQVSTLTCTATDPDGELLAYDWSSDTGTVTPGVGGSATFEAGQPGLATVTCTVTDPVGLAASESIEISISGAAAEKSLDRELLTPQDVAVDSLGGVYVADRQAGGLSVLHLSNGELVYHLPLPGAGSVAVDWSDRLLVGGTAGAAVMDRAGNILWNLDPGAQLGAVAAVAVDPSNQRYAVLYGDPGRVVVYDAGGTVISAFGSIGAAPEQLEAPGGLAFTPGGELVVADTGHGRIKVFNLSGTLLRSFGDLGGGLGEFVRLTDVAVDSAGVVYATDAFQSWVQAFNPDGSLREVLGHYGDGTGELKTPGGVAPAEAFDRLLVTSINTSSVQVFVLDPQPTLDLPAPAASLSPTSLVFGTRPVGLPSPPRTATLTNTGNAPLGLREVETAGDFTAAHACGSFLDPGQSCIFEVTFTPTAPGPREGSLSLDTSTGGEPLSVALSGTGILPGLPVAAPVQLSFADLPVGRVSDPKPVTLTNTGTVPLAVFAIGTSGEFTHSHDCRTPLAAGATCTIEVRFAPVSANLFLRGTLTIDTAGGAAEVRLHGSGVGRFLAGTPGTVDFGGRPLGDASPPETVTLTNTGNDHVRIETLRLEGAEADQFLLASDLCSELYMAAGEACTFEVVFLPTFDGDHSARVTVAASAFNAPLAVELTGTGGTQGVIEIPTLDEWALTMLALLLAALGLAALRGRRTS